MRGRLLSAGDRLARLLPARSRLGFRFALRKILGAFEHEFETFDRMTGRGRVAVDAGANEGWYSIRLSRRFDRVLAFEPNELLLGDLRTAGIPGIEVHAIALADRDGVAEYFVPLNRGVALTGWGSLDREHVPDRDGEVRSTVPVRTLDSFSLEVLDFLKVDVEGYELQLLEGARATLRRCRPIVLAEVLPTQLAAVTQLLAGCGLTRVDAGREGLRISPGNHLFRSVVTAGGGEDSPA